MGYVSDEEY